MMKNIFNENQMNLIIPEGNVLKIMNGDEVLWQRCNVPVGYTQVGWLAAAANVGTYIDLGFTFDTAAVITLELWLDGSTTTVYPFGAAENSGIYRCMLTCPISGNASAATIYGSRGDNFNGSQLYDCSVGKNKFSMLYKKGILTASNNTTEKTITNQIEYTMTNNLYLFGLNYNGSLRYGGKRQIGRFSYYDKDNHLKCDLYPCVRDSDGVAGMWDRANMIFLTNIGAGSFTAGPAI